MQTEISTGRRTVTLAHHAGFCFGVRRAVERLEKAQKKRAPGERIVTLGQLIHNEIFLARMKAAGVETVEEEGLAALVRSATAASPVCVLARAHGIPADLRERLDRYAAGNPAFRWEDCTCPFVSRIHEIAGRFPPENHQLWVFGGREHPEVVGFLSRFAGEKFVFANLEEFRTAWETGKLPNPCAKQPIIVQQTTYFLCEWKKVQKFIKNICTNPLIFDTICNVTELRQTEAEALSRVCDLMVVVGGKNSSNTKKLADTCRAVGAETWTVESAADLPQPFPNTYKRVGVVAGASTPSDIIEEVFETMSETENFEALLNETFNKTLNTGDVVTGTVEHVDDNEVQLDLGAGVTGYIKADQITDDPSAKLTALYKKGDEIEAFVIRVSDVEGVAELSKKRADSDRNWQNIVNAVDSGEVLEGQVIEAVKGGILVMVQGSRIFVPGSQTGVPKDGDLNALVGETVKLRIIEVKTGKKAIGSIRSVLRDEKKAKEAAFWANLENGMEFTGVVKSMTDFGAFVDLGGVDGMVHITELSWKRIKHPSQVVSIGDTITVFIKKFDAEKKRISLGYRTEATNPWNIFTSRYAIGDVATVKIVNLETFGAFAEIVDGVDGLIHISQLATKRVAKASDVLEIGQEVDAKILDIDNEKHKVSLSIRALLEEAEAPVEEAPAEAAEEAPADTAEDATTGVATEATTEAATEAATEAVEAPADAE